MWALKKPNHQYAWKHGNVLPFKLQSNFAHINQSFFVAYHSINSRVGVGVGWVWVWGGVGVIVCLHACIFYIFIFRILTDTHKHFYFYFLSLHIRTSNTSKTIVMPPLTHPPQAPHTPASSGLTAFGITRCELTAKSNQPSECSNGC